MVVPYTVSTAQYQPIGHAQAQQYRSNHHSMDSRPPASEYHQQSSTLPATNNYQAYSTTQLEPQTTENSVNNTTQHQSTNSQDARSTYSSSGTPTSESSAVYSTRNSNYENNQLVGQNRFVEGSQRYQPASTSSGGMARNVSKSNSPTVKADREISEDSPGAAASPSSFTPPSHYGPQYPQAQHPMSEGYQQPIGTPSQAWRQDWSPYGPSPHQMSNSPYGHSPSPTTMAGAPAMVSTARPIQGQKANRKRAGDPPTNHPLSQVYSFVPIPGATQTKRPRRRYEEIERMYKCGWNGCEKAYGTLNHLNAHVTMQGHGAKRTPDEFKEIRKEWKARKKEEETQRKAQEDEVRRRVGDDPHGPPNLDSQQPISNLPYQGGGMSSQQRQLPPPLTYQQPNVSMAPNGVHYSPSSAPTAPMENMQQYAPQPIYAGYAAPSQYGGQQPIYTGQQRAAQSNGNGNVGTTPGGEKPAESAGARV